jgi:hypothetical protein
MGRLLGTAKAGREEIASPAGCRRGITSPGVTTKVRRGCDVFGWIRVG